MASPSALPDKYAEVTCGRVSVVHVPPFGWIAIVTKLLTVTPPVRTYTGTQHPVGALLGIVKSIWSVPAQQGVRPLYRTGAETPPTNTSVLTGRLPAVGIMLSAATGPSPVPHNVMACPFCAVTVGELIGWLVAVMKFCKMPGPRPV